VTRGVLISVLALAGAFGAGCAAADPASFGKGAWSVGVNGGIAFLTMTDVNDQIRIENFSTQSQFEELHQGGEWTADARYAVAKNWFLGVESGSISGVSHDKAGTSELRVRGTPLVVQGGGTIDQSGMVAVRGFAALGALVNARFEEPGVGKVEGTAFMGYVGAELEVRFLGPVALTAQGLARSAMVSHPENAPYNVDFSGGSIRGGVRATFGGAP